MLFEGNRYGEFIKSPRTCRCREPFWSVKLALRHSLLQWAVPVSGDQQERLREEAL